MTDHEKAQHLADVGEQLLAQFTKPNQFSMSNLENNNLTNKWAADVIFFAESQSDSAVKKIIIENAEKAAGNSTQHTTKIIGSLLAFADKED